MIRRVAFLVMALTALFALQFADCLTPMSADQQMVQCCGSMPCNQGNQSHDCCKTMVSSPSSSVLPVEHAALNVPLAVVVDNPSAPEVVVIAEFSPPSGALPHRVLSLCLNLFS
jgi:hypothetical protein